jgi:hypothetical protein
MVAKCPATIVTLSERSCPWEIDIFCFHQKNCSECVPMILEVATVPSEDESNHGDRDRNELGDVLFPVHPNPVPTACRGIRH